MPIKVKRKRPDYRHQDDNITDWFDPDFLMEDTQYGPVTYRVWCVKEIERMTKAGAKNLYTKVGEDGMIAVAERNADEESEDNL